MLKKALACIVMVAAGIFMFFIPGIVGDEMNNSHYQGSFYDVYFIFRCLFLLFGTLTIFLSLVYFLNKKPE
ncbi:hypothetical protein AWM70_22375 [Paenibacillus yonginensis]|uniref:DUF3955 domain-containing protein n=1 Tax=Paenibacillus yonginensis TaxID=1462996 RepID=A0A1B1N6F2_9BACL|nr:hypothetical protein AWM70_22375 [Paenibacillus yonginensis]